MWAIEDAPGPKAAYRGGWYHFTSNYTTSPCILAPEKVIWCDVSRVSV